MIQVVVDDLAFVKADAVIRPTTSTMAPLCRSLSHLEKLGGETFRNQIPTNSELAVGSAVVSEAGDVEAGMVIHAVIQSVTDPVSEHSVRAALISALQRADDWQLARLVSPPIGTGAGNLSIEDSAKVMVQVLGSAMASATYPQEMCIVLDNEEDLAVFQDYLKRIPQ